jgi:Transglycosylase SLT domain
LWHQQLWGRQGEVTGKNLAWTRRTDGSGCDIQGIRIAWAKQRRLAGRLLICVLALGSAHANAQAGAAPRAVRGEIARLAALPPTADDVCRTLEQAAAENSLPLEFFARVIWQESHFNARAVSSKGAKGIAQFMPGTAHWHGLRNPFNPIEALRHSAGTNGSVEITDPTVPNGGRVTAGSPGSFPQHGIDLPNIAVGAQTTLACAENAAGTGGTLTVSDGRHAVAIDRAPWQLHRRELRHRHRRPRRHTGHASAN